MTGPVPGDDGGSPVVPECAPPSCDSPSGSALVVASGQAAPAGIVVDDKYVYWANAGEPYLSDNTKGSLMRAGLTGGEPEQVAQIDGQVLNVVQDAANLYWVTMNGAAGRAPKGGGPVETLFSAKKYDAEFISAVVDDKYLYCASADPPFVLRIDLVSGGTASFSKGYGQPFILAADTSSIYWAATNIYGTTRLMKASKADMVPMPLYSTGQTPYVVITGVARDQQMVYWSKWVSSDPQTSCKGQGSIMAMPSSGGDASIVAEDATMWTLSSRVVVDAENVYWTEAESGRIMKAPKTGGAPVVIACGQEQPIGIAVDQTHVYWTTFMGGSVMKAPK